LPSVGRRQNRIEINFRTIGQVCCCASHNRACASCGFANMRYHIALRKRIAELYGEEGAGGATGDAKAVMFHERFYQIGVSSEQFRHDREVVVVDDGIGPAWLPGQDLADWRSLSRIHAGLRSASPFEAAGRAHIAGADQPHGLGRGDAIRLPYLRGNRAIPRALV
jgi:hypothetical protein